MSVRKYQVELKGMTQLIMHWDNIEWADRMDEWRKDPANKASSKAGDDRTPPFRWLGSLYNDGEVVAIPYDNLGRCMMEGGAMVPTGKGQKTFKAQTQSGMRVSDAYAPLIVNGGHIQMADVLELEAETDFSKHMRKVRDLGFSLLVKRARIGQSKHIRVRPIFQDWALSFGVDVWDDAITEEVLSTDHRIRGPLQRSGRLATRRKDSGALWGFRVGKAERRVGRRLGMARLGQAGPGRAGPGTAGQGLAR